MENGESPRRVVYSKPPLVLGNMNRYPQQQHQRVASTTPRACSVVVPQQQAVVNDPDIKVRTIENMELQKELLKQQIKHYELQNELLTYQLKCIADGHDAIAKETAKLNLDLIRAAHAEDIPSYERRKMIRERSLTF